MKNTTTFYFPELIFFLFLFFLYSPTLYSWGFYDTQPAKLPSKALLPSGTYALKVVKTTEDWAAILSDGSIYFYGKNFKGEVLSPNGKKALLGDGMSIAATQEDFAVLMQDGTVFLFGKNFPSTGTFYTFPGGRIIDRHTTPQHATSVVATQEAFAIISDQGACCTINKKEVHLIIGAILISSPLVSQVVTTENSFIALCQDGRVLIWGKDYQGVPIEDLGAQFLFDKKAVSIVANKAAYAVLFEDQTVYHAGDPACGGSNDPHGEILATPDHKPIISLAPSENSFEAIIADKVTWGSTHPEAPTLAKLLPPDQTDQGSATMSTGDIPTVTLPEK